jgi:hypothetical protein
MHREAAEYYFERNLFMLVVKGELLPLDGGLTFSEAIDWARFVERGGGSITVMTVSVAAAAKVMRTEVPDLLPPKIELAVRWADNGHGDWMCFIIDPGELVDPWIFDGIKEQVMKQGRAANTLPI